MDNIEIEEIQPQKEREREREKEKDKDKDKDKEKKDKGKEKKGKKKKKKKEKEKKDRKEKKEKKSKKDKKEQSGDEEEETEWVEAPSLLNDPEFVPTGKNLFQKPSLGLKREEWMLVPPSKKNLFSNEQQEDIEKEETKRKENREKNLSEHRKEKDKLELELSQLGVDFTDKRHSNKKTSLDTRDQIYSANYDLEEDEEFGGLFGVKKRKKRDQDSKLVDQEQQRKQRILDTYNQAQKGYADCWFCYQPNKSFPLLISLANRAYLSLLKKGTMIDGHCLIIPTEHTISSVEMDSDTYDEIRNFKKCLILMFDQFQQQPIFFETITNPKRAYHLFIECIPLPYQLAAKAPMYFKKAILDSGSEWSDNPKLIDTTEKGIRSSVPKNFPYFHVDFYLTRSFAHVIENPVKFPRSFAKQVIGGMLELGPESWLNPKSEPFHIEQQRVKEFSEKWKPFDWTTQITK